MWSQIQSDIQCILERDPAARSKWDVVFSYPGFHAVVIHRFAHTMWKKGWTFPARWLSHWSRFLTGIEIHPGATIGRNVFIDHGMGVVIGEMAEIGDGCTIYQGVTLGGTSLVKGAKRHPTLEAGVIVGANACILGGFTVGEGARVGSGAVVNKPVPAGATAVGNPARIILPESKEEQAPAAKPVESPAPQSFSAYGVTGGAYDPVSRTVRGLIDSADTHEHQIAKLWQALEKLSQQVDQGDCIPQDAARQEQDISKLKDLLGK